MFYQTLEDLIESTHQKNNEIEGFDSSCFNGEYVTGDIDQTYLQRLHQQRNDAAKAQREDDDEQQ